MKMQTATQVLLVCLAAIFLGACSSDVPKPGFVTTVDAVGWDLPAVGDVPVINLMGFKYVVNGSGCF